MIIDIYGIPGSGKSFYGSHLNNKFPRKITFNLIEFERKTILGKALKRILEKIVLLLLKINCLPKLTGLQKDKYHARYNAGRNIITYEARLWSLIILFRIMPKKKIIIVDEGIWHVVATLAVEYGITDEEFKVVLKNIQNYFPNKIESTSVYQYSSVELAIKSIKERNRKVAAIDFLSGKELITFLTEYKYWVDFIYKDNRQHKINVR